MEKRKCFVEWINRWKVRLTTPYKQKVFEFTSSDDLKQINLITLKKMDGIDDDRFFAEIVKTGMIDYDWYLKVFCKDRPSSITHIGDSEIKNNRNRYFIVNIPVK